jgi:putative CocE/NonD family hydrolase
MSIPGTAFPGARDARPFERQDEVRTWTTVPLTEPVEWTGEVRAEIFASSTARDTDFLLRVSDVYPDGRSMLLMDYPLRARYREGFEKEVLLTPEEPAKLAWHIGWTSIILNKGHRIRVTMASTGYPLYEPNNQTGRSQTMDWMKTSVAAINTIWHDTTHASRIIVPEISSSR